MNKYPHVLSFVQKTPWAILPEKGMQILDFLDLKAQGVVFTQAEIEARIGADARKPRASTSGDVAVLPLYGVVSQRINESQAISGDGGTSVEKFTKRFREAVENPNVKAIVLDVDSPGGSVYGVTELATEIFAARSKKYIVAVANSMAASAAYWIASAASEFVVTPGGEVGSIGVYMMHSDYSAMMEAEGIKNTFISAGQNKTEGNPFEPLSDEAKAHLQEQVDAYNTMFVSAVAKHRGVSVSAVNEQFGQGRMYMAKDAKTRGMVDGISTLDEVLGRLGAKPTAQQRPLAETEQKRFVETERKKIALL